MSIQSSSISHHSSVGTSALACVSTNEQKSSKKSVKMSAVAKDALSSALTAPSLPTNIETELKLAQTHEGKKAATSLPEADQAFFFPPYFPKNEENLKKLVLSVRTSYLLCLTNKQKLSSPIGSLDHDELYDLSKKTIIIKDSSGKEARLTHVKISVYSCVDGKPTSLKVVFTLNGIEESYIIPPHVIKRGIQEEFLDGTELERIHSPNLICPEPEEFWDSWETTKRGAAQVYDGVIHPQIVMGIKTISKEHRTFSILDLGGGSGKLAALIIKQISNVRSVLVADQSKPLLAEAEKRNKECQNKLVTKEVNLKNLNDDTLDEIVSKEKQDLIILCGVVAHQVLSKETGTQVIKQCLNVLKPKAFIIAASLSPALLNSEEYEKMGLKVHNKTFIFRNVNTQNVERFIIIDFYILQKK